MSTKVMPVVAAVLAAPQGVPQGTPLPNVQVGGDHSPASPNPGASTFTSGFALPQVAPTGSPTPAPAPATSAPTGSPFPSSLGNGIFLVQQQPGGSPFPIGLNGGVGASSPSASAAAQGGSGGSPFPAGLNGLGVAPQPGGAGGTTGGSPFPLFINPGAPAGGGQDTSSGSSADKFRFGGPGVFQGDVRVEVGFNGLKEIGEAETSEDLDPERETQFSDGRISLLANFHINPSEVSPMPFVGGIPLVGGFLSNLSRAQYHIEDFGVRFNAVRQHHDPNAEFTYKLGISTEGDLWQTGENKENDPNNPKLGLTWYNFREIPRDERTFFINPGSRGNGLVAYLAPAWSGTTFFGQYQKSEAREEDSQQIGFESDQMFKAGIFLPIGALSTSSTTTTIGADGKPQTLTKPFSADETFWRSSKFAIFYENHQLEDLTDPLAGEDGVASLGNHDITARSNGWGAAYEYHGGENPTSTDFLNKILSHATLHLELKSVKMDFEDSNMPLKEDNLSYLGFVGWYERVIPVGSLAFAKLRLYADRDKVVGGVDNGELSFEPATTVGAKITLFSTPFDLTSAMKR